MNSLLPLVQNRAENGSDGEMVAVTAPIPGEVQRDKNPAPDLR